MSRKGRYLFTSESVTEGHPDKIADQISDSILDAILAQDPVGRVACETLVTTGLAIIAGEITTSCYVDFPKIVRETIKDVGYTRAKFGFDSETCAVLSSIHEQSPDIAQGVDPGGAGDQGLMFGYACTETAELMPLPIMLAHKLVRGLSENRRSGALEYLRPDGKSQVTVEYDGYKPVRVDTVVISTQHSSTVDNDTLREDITDKIVNKVIPADAGDLARPALTRHAIGKDFCQLSGDDITAAAFMAQGGMGCISVLSNVAPAQSAAMYNAWFKKDFAAFEKIRDALTPLAKNLFVEPNPTLIKYAVSKIGFCTDDLRLPLVRGSDSARKLVDEAMAHAGINSAAAAPRAKAHG